MHTLKESARFLKSLYAGGKPATRSVHEWDQILSGLQVSSVNNIMLAPTSKSELDGYVGLFDFGSGFKTYELCRHNSKITAVPMDGVGPHYSIDDSTLPLLRADPSKLFHSVISASNFKIDDSIKGLPEGVAIARRKVGSLNIVCIVALDDRWLNSDARDIWINSTINCMDHLILLNQTGSRPNWTLNSGVRLDVAQIPLWNVGFKIPRFLYCRAELGHTAFDAKDIYNEKEIIVDDRTGEIFIYGTRIVTSSDSRAGLYIRGLCRLGPSPVHMNVFAYDYLDWKMDDQQKEKVRDAKKDAKTQIRASFGKNKELATKAEQLICPRSDEYGLVSKPFTEEKCLSWGVDEFNL